MSVPLHLYSHLRIHQVFGANTDVGKTLFTTALCLAETHFSSPGKQVHYLKPVSTGPASGSDTTHLNAHVSNLSRTATLVQYPDALSPHLAARKACGDELHKIPTDHDLRARISSWISETASLTMEARPDVQQGTNSSVLYLETAGGVHSPTPSGSSQATLLRPFRFPTILIGSPHLGGISATISAYESLVLQGYNIDAILLIAEQEGAEKWGNAEYLAKWTEERADEGLRFWSIGGPSLERGLSTSAWGPPPERGSSTDAEDREAMRQWYHGLVHGNGQPGPPSSSSSTQGLSAVLQHLQQRHNARLQNLDSLAQRTRDVCWWPFTQHEQFKSNSDVTVIDSAYGDMFVSYTKPTSSSRQDDQQGSNSPGSLLSPLLDSSASWWTQCLGHAHPRLALAAARAAARYGHVIFPGAANEPATKLSELLLGRSPVDSSSIKSKPSVAPWASRVFFSDDGSTGTEVAFKMAIASAEARYSTRTGQPSASLPRTAQADVDAKAVPAAGTAKASRSSSSKFMPAQTQVDRAPLQPAVLGLRGSYHGDTIGAMDASDPSVYNARVPWYTGKGAWIGAPVVRFKDGVAAVEADIDVGAEQEWDSIVDALGPSSSAVSLSSSVAWRREYGSLSDVYDLSHRLTSDPLVGIYRRHLQTLLRQVAEQHAVVGPGGKGDGYRFSALVLEPIILGAGGMRFVDPLFQRVLVDVVREDGEELFGSWDDFPRLGASGGRKSPGASSRKEGDWRGLPVVFDEVFTGLYRLGQLSPSRSLLGVNPDILVLAKILTGGLVPMSVTLASSSIFETFTFPGSTKVDALLHGHSYTAHAVGCEVAQETLGILSRMDGEGAWEASRKEWQTPSQPSHLADGEARQGTNVGQSSPIWSFWSADAVDKLSRSARVRSVMTLGTVLVVELVDENGGYASSAATDILRTLRTQPVKDIIGSTTEADHFRIHARPLGNVLYFMSSLNSPAETLRSTEKALLALLP
ncbi:unnamed protein product [Tilletia controversa]|uniref:Dethiobiotin synthase n=3 Tax=Tilletia TaxID=13289 RepID=A0A8X7MXW9_9BASI|nr:hypothetical protein CF336_g680 [Tilletia laevis]KAE8204286.1 hypothetical protein CF328_g1166 [Tilletia controversa]KAE8265254.1 hypothetical protein A4X03_0g382 [Tilletia caries]KAE8208584.1 hypothetical protein CF335_g308 [Tilletia laevis]KAE8253188.1 hypothetical protein A4X06_0g1634 [Tilletia controversa]